MVSCTIFQDNLKQLLSLYDFIKSGPIDLKLRITFVINCLMTFHIISHQ